MAKESNSDEPFYLSLHQRGELSKRAEILLSKLTSCCLCPRSCKVNRKEGEHGVCNAGSQVQVSSFHPHFGEEAPLVGSGGSGTVFFTHCNLRCVFCINGDISIKGRGNTYGISELAGMMLRLQEIGCHNINLVSPTHYSPHIVFALDLAASQGLRIPLVYNTSGYEEAGILNILNGVVDIYLCDFKYADPATAAKYSSGADDYPVSVKKALLEMNRQVGVAIPDANGLMQRGLMIRHLVMPENASGTADVLEWIAGHLPIDTYINLMSQYRPSHDAISFPEIARPIYREEYNAAVNKARKLGFSNLEIQGIWI